MKQQPKVTFLMMAYNTEKYIAKAIESVLNQTEQNIELCIRNNGSTDSTGAIIRKYAQKDSRVSFIENETNGVTDDGLKPFEEGWWPFSETVGEYISIIDSDDWLSPDFTEILYKEAKRNSVDLVVGGCFFVDEGTNILGERNPPYYNSIINNDIRPFFIGIYNSLRTWWGKLYKTDFFLQNYKACWSPIEPLDWVLDTAVVLEYLTRSQSAVFINRPLYYFLARSNSAYSSRPFDNARIIEANLLYQKGLNVLEVLKGHSIENDAFLLSLHWGYLVEAMSGMTNNTKSTESSNWHKLRRLSDVLNDKLVGSYLNNNFELIFNTMGNYVSKIIEEETQNSLNSIWSSYIARLYFFRNQLKMDSDSVLLIPILISCLCDKDNKNSAGALYFLKEIRGFKYQNLSVGEKQFLQCNATEHSFMFDHPQELLEMINKYDRTSEIIDKENVLIESIKKEDFEIACNLIEEISIIAPFNLIAMYYRIYVSCIFKELELANILAATAKVLWPDEREIQLLYWEIQKLNLENRGS